jgi:hypothetical protein
LKRNAGLVVLKGTETFAAVKKRSQQSRVVREKLYIYIYIIVLLLVEFVKDERGGPETMGSDDQGKSPRLLLLLLLLLFLTLKLLSLSFSRSLQLPRKSRARRIIIR